MSGSPLSLLQSSLQSSLRSSLRSSLLSSLLLGAGLAGNAPAGELIYQGPPGSSGLTGATPGAAGTAGGAGSAAIVNIFSSDLSNLLGITGGAGGVGGDGANGGPGQPAGAAGAGAAGGFGSATLGATGLVSGPVTSLWVQGVGGVGGAAGQSGDNPVTGGDAAGGAGGNGLARGTLTSNSATVTAQSAATGGMGGSAVLGRAGNGGNANASLAITLASTVNATIDATATGGSGGSAFGDPFEVPQSGIPGAGGNAVSAVTVAGTAPAGGGWNAVLDITSTALGGGPGLGFQALDGGTANASVEVTGYGRTSGSALALGSYGAEAGGSAVADARVVSSYSAVASASAVGGGALYNAGAPATAFAQANGGYHASADARAQSNSGRFGFTSPAPAEAVAAVHRLAGAPLPPASALVSEARAHAVAIGQGSTVRATSSYRDDQLGAAVGVIAASRAPSGEFQPEAYSAANVGGAAYGPPVFDDANPAQIIAYASALPTAASVATLLAAAPVVSAAFANGQVLGAGTVGAMFYPFASSATYQLPFASGQHLLLGLLNPFQDDAPFAAFTFAVSNGGFGLYSGSFSTPAQYATFFGDKVLDLGAINSDTLDLLVTFTLTEGIYGFNYVLGSGNALAPVPEPFTWLMLMLGLGLLVWRAPLRLRVAQPG